VFLRELISNASDALEKARHLSLTRPEDVESCALQIRLELDEAANTLTLVDTGVGMTRQELQSHLGTIARSGTKAFLKTLQENPSAGSDNGSGIIGKFGVGFYSAFMVAETVEVFTKSALLPDAEGLCWKSSGDGRYSISAAAEAERGTRIVLHLKARASPSPSQPGRRTSSLGDAESSRWVTLRARWVTLRAHWVTLRARWVTLRALAG
jgi:HSP90 family molecular chaperone